MYLIENAYPLAINVKTIFMTITIIKNNFLIHLNTSIKNEVHQLVYSYNNNTFKFRSFSFSNHID